MNAILHELIIIISNQGHTDEIMKTAKEHGARGGTIVHGKGTADQETIRFFGLKIQPEKELVLIVVPKALTDEIMQHVSLEHGPHTQASALCFSLPVTKTQGFTF